MTKIERTLEVKAPVEKVYAVCEDVENYINFMDGAREIKMTGEKTSHWKMELLGRAVEFDGEFTECVKNERLTWELKGDLKSTGSWILNPTAGGTQVTYVMDYKMPGIMGAIIDKIKVTKEMEKGIETSLDAFKKIVETK